VDVIDKLLLALKELLKSIKIDVNNATLHEQLVRFALAVQKGGDSIKPAVKAVIDNHWETLYQMHGKDLSAFSAAFLEKNKDSDSVPHLISAAIAVSLIDNNNNKTKAEEIIFRMADGDKYARTRSLDNCLLARKALRSFKSSRVQEFTTKAAEWYPHAAALRS
jgi:protein-disulfide isomerase-like protein with CxxC motif